MVFHKTFPRESEKSAYPKWIEVALSDEEEADQDRIAREENKKILKESIIDAKDIMRDLKPFQSDVINLAIALFEKRASHVVYYKERKAKEKFDQL